MKTTTTTKAIKAANDAKNIVFKLTRGNVQFSQLAWEATNYAVRRGVHPAMAVRAVVFDIYRKNSVLAERAVHLYERINSQIGSFEDILEDEMESIFSLELSDTKS